MGHIYYNDKRILVGETRKPKENEFVYDQRITFQPDCLDSIFEYIEVFQMLELNGWIKMNLSIRI